MKAITVIAALFLAGCATGLEPMLDNRYMEVSAEAVPKGMAGAWTGTLGPYLLTFVLNQDGTGLSCGSWHKHSSTGRVKYRGGVLYTSDGGALLANLVGDTLVLTMKERPAPMPADHKFVRDDGLKEAAPYCKKELS